MAIIIPDPIVVPPQPEKIADKVWIITMNVNAAAGVTAPTTAYFSVAPFISATGEILKSQTQPIYVSDMFAECSSDPKLAQAVGAIYIAVEELCKKRHLFGMEPDPVEPVITLQPKSSTIYESQNTTFIVEATGGKLSYQWNKDEQPIQGAIGNSLVFQNVTTTDGGNYNVTVTNPTGSVISDTVALTVIEIQSPTIMSQSESTTVPEYCPLELSVNAVGGALTYQWKKNGDNIFGETKPILSFSKPPVPIGIKTTDAGEYTVVVSNSKGSVTSNTITVTVTPLS